MYPDPRFKTGIHQNLLAIWNDAGHGADVFFDLDTGVIWEITDWDDGRGLFENGADMDVVITEARDAIREALRGSVPTC